MQQINLGRPKDLKKRQAILDAAKILFLEQGYDKSSMDAIAQKAGVSKLTLYSHFRDKSQLFSAAIEMVCEQCLPKQYYEFDQTSNIQHLLQQLATAFLSMLYSPEAIKLTLLMSGLVSSNIDVVHLFYHAGPERTRQNMHAFFQKLQEQHLLNIDDSLQCTDLFLALLTDCHYDRVIWQVLESPTAEQIQTMAAQRVALFLRVYPVQC